MPALANPDVELFERRDEGAPLFEISTKEPHAVEDGDDFDDIVIALMTIDNTVCADDQLTHIAIAQLGNDTADLRGRGEQVNRRNDFLRHELRIVIRVARDEVPDRLEVVDGLGRPAN
ncbi:MAG: hypothetical protein ABIV93_21930 [Byssovorax sp.]